MNPLLKPENLYFLILNPINQTASCAPMQHRTALAWVVFSSKLALRSASLRRPHLVFGSNPELPSQLPGLGLGLLLGKEVTTEHALLLLDGMEELHLPLLPAVVKLDTPHGRARVFRLRGLQLALANELLAVGLSFLQCSLDSCLLAKALLEELGSVE